MIEEAIYQLLIQSIVNDDIDNKVFIDNATQTTANPCIVLSQSLIELSDTKTGVSKLDVYAVQIDLFSDSTKQRRDIWAKIEYADKYPLCKFTKRDIFGLQKYWKKIKNKKKSLDKQQELK